jgi:hypothetical protein
MRFILEGDYRLRITEIMNQQLWGTKLKSNYTWGYGSKNAEYQGRFEVITAAIMKNVVFWYIKTLFVLQRRHITSPLQSAAG